MAAPLPFLNVVLAQSLFSSIKSSVVFSVTLGGAERMVAAGEGATFRFSEGISSSVKAGSVGLI